MPTIKNVFTGAKMSRDVDERLLKKGEYRYAKNIRIANSEGSDVGAIEKSLSNKQLTNLFLGSEVKTIGGTSDEFEEKLYWLVKSDLGCYIVEYDTVRDTASFVLKDTRPKQTNVLSFSEDFLVTGIVLIVDTDNNNRFIIFSDNNTQPKCVNIERAKTYGENGFDEEMILLIKKPPIDAPKIELSETQSGEENNIKEKYLRFGYRNKYLDGEYSAISPLSEVAFMAKNFQFNFATSVNEGMVNKYSKVNITINTGSKLVTDVEVVFVESGNNIPYLIGSYNKEQKGWEHHKNKSITFSNNKIYKNLAENQLFRLFDAVPLKAKALEIINSRIVFGNYTENYNLVDVYNNEILVDFKLDYKSFEIKSETPNKSCKSNRDIEATIVYLDEYGRMTTPLVSEKNTVYIKNKHSVTKNVLNITIKSRPPKWAKYFRIFIKQSKVVYDTIVPDVFYLQEGAAWVKLNSSDIDKVQKENFLVVKGDTSKILTDSLTKVRVLSVDKKEKNFISDKDGGQEAGVYFKIKPDNFRLNTEDLVHFGYGGYDNSRTSYNNPLRGLTNYHEVVYKGRGGLNDMKSVGNYNASEDNRYLIEIDGVGDGVTTFDTFKWSKDGGATYVSEKNDIVPNTNFTLEKGISIQFKEKIGHTADDKWVISAKSNFGIKGDYIAYSLFSPEQDNINANTSIRIYIDEHDEHIFKLDKTFVSSRRYENIEEWYYGDKIYDFFNKHLPAPRKVRFRRGHRHSYQSSMYFEQNTDTGIVTMIINTGEEEGSGLARVRYKFYTTSYDNIPIFETEPKEENSDIFYEIGKTYKIEDGYHLGYDDDDISQTQNNDAVLQLPFFNCFTWGNGFESIKIKDLFNSNVLSIKTRPSVPIENYRENTRIASLTYGKQYDQSLNYNGLNEFNLSELNFKDLDDRYGSIQKIMTYDTDLDVWQEDKVHKVLYGKSTLYNEDGSGNVGKSDMVLGTVIPYAGEFGISTHPESLVPFGNYRYWADAKRGVVLRKGQSGIEIISKYGMRDWFRNFMRNNYRKPIFGAYDPYYGQYTIRLEEDDTPIEPIYNCGNIIFKNNQKETFSYILQLNDLTGNIELPYQITEGTAKIEAKFKGITHTKNNISGNGILSFSRSDVQENKVYVSIIPISDVVSYSIGNTCPIGETIKVVHVVVNNDKDVGKNIVNKFKWGNSNYYTEEISFTNKLVSLTEYNGIAGRGRYPLSGKDIEIQSYKDELNNGEFEADNRLGYLVSDTVYTEATVNTLLDIANYPAVNKVVSGNVETNSIKFNYNKTGNILYLIWDYNRSNSAPIANDDSINVQVGQSVNINVLANDTDAEGDILTPIIVSQPLHGTIEVNADKTIKYTHNGSDNFDDSFTYKVNDGNTDSNIATVSISIGISCSGSINASGSVGIYEFIMTVGTETGITGVKCDSYGVPDRFQVEYDGQIVADSKYVGDYIKGTPSGYPNLIGTHSNLKVFRYNGSKFVDSGEVRTITVAQNDIANGTTEPTDGNIDLTFNKTQATPTVVKIIITAPVGGTAWNIRGICPK